MPVNEIGIEDDWTTKPSTAGNLRGRIDKILVWATAMGFHTGLNPASGDGPLMHLPPSLSREQRQQRHHMPDPILILARIATNAPAMRKRKAVQFVHAAHVFLWPGYAFLRPRHPSKPLAQKHVECKGKTSDV